MQANERIGAGIMVEASADSTASTCVAGIGSSLCD
jgi:hypothetical protein